LLGEDFLDPLEDFFTRRCQIDLAYSLLG